MIRSQSTRCLSQNSHWHHADNHYFFNSKLSNKHGVWSTISFKNLGAGQNRLYRMLCRHAADRGPATLDSTYLNTSLPVVDTV
jgi:hypothetical protein